MSRNLYSQSKCLYLKPYRPWLHRLHALLRGTVLPDRRKSHTSTAEVIGEMRRDFYGMGRRHDD
jgi:hypothetical protein